MSRAPLLVELCAGTAALSLRLAAKHARPPVSRMGAKTGYADVILRALGLRPGQGADRYLWCEPDDGVRLLLHAYTDRALASAAAEIIRGWKDEEPRALWERLRAEGPAKCPPVDAREVARWGFMQSRAPQGHGPGSALGEGFIGSREESPDGLSGRAKSRAALASDIGSTQTLPALITDDARDVDAREVARWLNVEAWSNGGRYMGPDRPSSCHPPGWVASITSDGIAGRSDALPQVSATITPDARPLEPVNLPPGTVAYMDPPYQGTTPYAHLLPREDVVSMARKWADADGGRVARGRDWRGKGRAKEDI